MKQNVLSEHGNRSRLGLLCMSALAALLLASFVGPASTRSAIASAAGTTAFAPAPQALPVRPWTAVGSTGTVDEASLNIYAFGMTEIGFKPGVPGSVVVARYNVTNTFDNNAAPNKPGWHTLEMGSNAPNSTIIEAKLFQVKSCTPDPVLLCATRNRSQDHPCATCNIIGTIDFTDNLYYVEVTLNRFNSTTANPRMFTLRLF
ncbi:MAG TPA: hypothetical protein VGJ55_07770 [Pyrinomonadaceae bacterium]